MNCTAHPDVPAMAVQVGQNGERRGAVDLFTRLDPLIERPVPDVLFCRACWVAKFGDARIAAAREGV